MDTKCTQCGVIYPSIASFSHSESPLLCLRCEHKSAEKAEFHTTGVHISEEALKHMSRQQLLKLKGVCRFWSVADRMGLTSVQCQSIGKTLKETERGGGDAWETIGVKRDHHAWMVKIEKFTQWYQDQFDSFGQCTQP